MVCVWFFFIHRIILTLIFEDLFRNLLDGYVVCVYIYIYITIKKALLHILREIRAFSFMFEKCLFLETFSEPYLYNITVINGGYTIKVYF